MTKRFFLLKRKISKKINIPVITPNSKLKLGWDFLVMVTVLYKFFSISIHLCFFSLPISKDIFSASSYHLNVLENIYMVIVMVLDIVLTLNMAYYENGIVVNDKHLIKEKYINTHFVFDLFPLFACLIQLFLISIQRDVQLRYVVFASYVIILVRE